MSLDEFMRLKAGRREVLKYLSSAIILNSLPVPDSEKPFSIENLIKTFNEKEEAPTKKTVKITTRNGNIVPIVYERYGNQGTPLFMSHGLLGDMNSLRELAIKLSNDYPVFIWDQKGCGFSGTKEGESYSSKDYVHETNQLIDKLADEKKVYMVGTSYGAELTRNFLSSEYGERIIASCFITPYVPQITIAKVQSKLERIFSSDIASNLCHSILNERNCRRSIEKGFFNDNDPHIEKLAKAKFEYLENNWSIAREICWAAKMEINKLKTIEGYQKNIDTSKILLISSANDRIIELRKDAEDLFSKLFPRLNFDIFYGSAGHFIHLEQPDYVVGKIMPFFRVYKNAA